MALPYAKHIKKNGEQRAMKCVMLSFCFLVSIFSFSQNGIDISMVRVDGGSYVMGSDDGPRNQRPAHKVEIDTFYIGTYEVTQGLWLTVMDDTPSAFHGCGDCPVEQVGPDQIDSFLYKINQLTGKHYRLPTETEWEYTAIGGNKSIGYEYSGSNDLAEVAWYEDNANGKTHPVGLKKPNELGIYDMSGNVWELCSDHYDAAYYKHSPASNPYNNHKAAYRVVRGGSWRSPKERCYAKARNRNIADHRRGNGGFRLAMDK